MWQFDSKFAKIYDDHVRQHIPHYQTVINKAVECCYELCSPSDTIIDFGCANGYTLEKLSMLGFHNLIGIDASKEMIDVCNKNIAKYYHSSTILDKKCKAVIANWTLHFNENKEEIIGDISSQLEEGGFLFLSEKTINSEYVKKKYYDLKHAQGVSRVDIELKEQSLAGSMFLNSIDWYFKILRDNGFKTIDTIDSEWGFVSLLAFK